MYTFDVQWRVEGGSFVEVSYDELAKSGWNFNEAKRMSAEELFEALNDHFDGDLLRDAVEDWYERDVPEIIQITTNDGLDN